MRFGDFSWKWVGYNMAPLLASYIRHVIQYGGRNRKQTYGEAVCFIYLVLRHAKCKVTKSLSMLSESPRSTEANSMSDDLQRNRKQHGGCCKPEVLISHVLVSVETKFQRTYQCFWSRPGQQKHTQSWSTIIDTGNNLAASANRKYLYLRLWYI